MRSMAFAFAAVMLLSSPALAEVKVQEVKSENGLKAWLIEDHTLPIITARVAFENSGVAYDPVGKEGLADFVSNMLDEGAGNLDSLAFHSALESNAIRFGASAGEDTFTASVQTLSRYKDRAFDLFNLALAAPRFDEEAIERVRKGNVSELKELLEDPEYRASLAWKEAAFAGHPYGRPRHGTFESLAHITQGDLKTFASWHFTCSPKVIAVVGDITAREVQDWLIRLPQGQGCAAMSPFGELKDTSIAPGKDAPILVGMEVPQTVVVAGVPGIRRENPRYYTIEVLNYILGGNSLTSRLGSEIRNKRGLAYYAQSQAEAFDHAGPAEEHRAMIEQADAKRALQAIELPDHGVDGAPGGPGR